MDMKQSIKLIHNDTLNILRDFGYNRLLGNLSEEELIMVVRKHILSRLALECLLTKTRELQQKLRNFSVLRERI